MARRLTIVVEVPDWVYAANHNPLDAVTSFVQVDPDVTLVTAAWAVGRPAAAGVQIGDANTQVNNFGPD